MTETLETIDAIGTLDHDRANEYIIFGPPGTGKSTNLTRQIRRAVARFGESGVMATSFSRAAAAELVSRDLPIPREAVGTLHSHCFRALGSPKIAEANVDEWNRSNPSLALTAQRAGGRLDGEEAAMEADGASVGGDMWLSDLCRYRARMVPREAWPANLLHFEKRWTAYKQEYDLLDFTDLIETALRDVRIAPGRPSVLFADEAQDFTRLEFALVRQWGRNAEYFVVAGDDDQCQPPGTMVETTDHGYVPIEALDPEKHRLVCYDRESGTVIGRKRGAHFAVSSRQVNALLYTVATDARSTSGTAEHMWVARWNRKTTKAEKPCCVYLMRRGSNFRIGWCQMFRADGCFHLGVRCNAEKADAAWILKVFSDRQQASLYESRVSAEYGIPLVTFEPINGAQHYNRAALREFWSHFETPDQALRASCCLHDHGRAFRIPMWSRGIMNRFGSQIFNCCSINLIPEYMLVPEVAGGKTVVWKQFTVEKRDYDGPVYSLAVDRYRTYIANGLVTHNCIFSFTGASPDPLIVNDLPDDHRIVLKQSYRVPAKVHAAAERLIRRVSQRQPKEYRPRDEEGAIGKMFAGTWKCPEQVVAHAGEQLAAGRSVMFLASCSYMLSPLLKLLRDAGIPFHNPYRASNGAWNPLRRDARGSASNRILALLASHPAADACKSAWSFGDVALWAEWMEAKGVMRRGSKKALADADHTRPVLIEDLAAIFEEGALDQMLAAFENNWTDLLDWWRGTLAASHRPKAEFAAQIALRGGVDALSAEPAAVVGTIHSVKGGQADVVYLWPDLSRAGWSEFERFGQPRDSVIRLMYVGMTRAKQELYWCPQASPMAFNL